MKVSELIEQLKAYGPDAEVCMCRGGSHFGCDLYDVESVSAEYRTLGIATESPETSEVVVLDTDMCGL